jgi:hypothetical protein
MPHGDAVVLSRRERDELEKRVRSRDLRAGDVRRARLILMLADRESFDPIQEALDVVARTSLIGRRAFLAAGSLGFTRVIVGASEKC